MDAAQYEQGMKLFLGQCPTSASLQAQNSEPAQHGAGLFAQTSDRRLPPQHPLLRHLQQVAAVLRQQIERVGYVGNVLDVCVFEAHAVKRFQQIGGCTIAL